MIYLSQFLDKTVMVLGLGRTGMSLVLNLLHCHCKKIYVYDDNPDRMSQILNSKDINSLLFKDGLEEKIFYYNHKADKGHDILKEVNYIIISPGINHNKHPIINDASALGSIKITNDIEEFVKATLQNMHIAITGTNGKSTTCSLIQHVLSSKYNRVQLGGNIGKPASDMIYYAQNCNYVLELSSFQLETLKNATFNIVGVTNITEDHMDRYESFKRYAEVKESLYRRVQSGGYALFSADSELVNRMYKKYCTILRKAGSKKFMPILLSTEKVLENGISIVDDTITDNIFGDKFHVVRPKSLRGIHNAQNLLFAYCVCRIRGISGTKFSTTITNFQGLPHRVEQFFENEYAIFIDDSKATNTDAMLKSISAFENILLIVGGFNKENGFPKIAQYKDRIKKCFVIGQDREFYLKNLKLLDIETYDACTMQNAVESIKAFLKEFKDGNSKGSLRYTVLLSPSASSVDQFANYMQRGKVFKELVHKLF